MKQLLLTIAFILASTITLVAQEDVKGVAILKPVDEVGDVSAGVKLNLRATLSYAINHMSGYEAYTRVNLSAIMDEHKFQRTGFVDNLQIKKIGKATGAKYILIAEVAYYDEQHITVTASIIDIETTKIKGASDPVISPVDPDGMRESCIKIARSLLDLDGMPQSGARTSNLSVNKKNGTSTSSSNDKVPTVYIDLGLPSGTKWGNANAKGFYSYNEAVSKFGNRLPTKAQWNELRDECQWTWVGGGYNVIGPNGNSITLPAVTGYRNCIGEMEDGGYISDYWTSTSCRNIEFAWIFSFSSDDIDVDYNYQCRGYSVRLVQNK